MFFTAAPTELWSKTPHRCVGEVAVQDANRKEVAAYVKTSKHTINIKVKTTEAQIKLSFPATRLRTFNGIY